MFAQKEVTEGWIRPKWFEMEGFGFRVFDMQMFLVFFVLCTMLPVQVPG